MGIKMDCCSGDNTIIIPTEEGKNVLYSIDNNTRPTPTRDVRIRFEEDREFYFLREPILG